MAPLSSLHVFGLFLSFAFRANAQVPSDVPPAQVVRDHASQVKLQEHASNCELAAYIALELSDKLYYKAEGNFALWDAQQHELTPACRVEPSTSEDVALVLGILVKDQCPFAIKSGGHSRFAGASNSDGGVMIDLVRIKEVEISKDTKTVRVGSGAVWFDVYSTLEEKDLMAVGGRVGDVGVGGLVLGGGISFFSPRYGWAMDSVTEYELVLPNSTIITATETKNPDLYFALRGGSNNFGIVTHFALETFPQGDMMGGSKSYTNDKNDAILAAMHKFTENTEQLDAATYTAFVYFQLYDMFMVVVQQVSAKPEMDPPEFDDFKKIEAMGSTCRIDRMSNLTKEITAASPHGNRNIYSTLTYFPSLELNKKILTMFQEEAEAVKTIEGLAPALVIQPLYKQAISLMKKRGGNSLGLDVEGPLTIMSTALAWKNAADDEKMYAFNKVIMERSKAAAVEMGLYHPYLYQNYASRDQDVFESYGKSGLERLRAIQRGVDPEGVFQKGGLCDGYFNVLEREKEAGGKGGWVKDEL